MLFEYVYTLKSNPSRMAQTERVVEMENNNIANNIVLIEKSNAARG